VARARIALLPNLPVPPGTGAVPQRSPQVVPQTPSLPAQPQGGTEIRNAVIQGPQRQVGIQ
jgi:hypothetical protein